MDEVKEAFNAQDLDERGVVVVQKGSMKCFGTEASCSVSEFDGIDVPRIDLRGGSISPGLLTYGSPLGLEEIAGEPSTKDGYVYDLLAGDVPSIVGGDKAAIHAVDGLQFAGRNTL